MLHLSMRNQKRANKRSQFVVIVIINIDLRAIIKHMITKFDSPSWYCIEGVVIKQTDMTKSTRLLTLFKTRAAVDHTR